MDPQKTLTDQPTGREPMASPVRRHSAQSPLSPAIAAMLGGLLAGGILIHALHAPKQSPALERAKTLPIP